MGKEQAVNASIERNQKRNYKMMTLVLLLPYTKQLVQHRISNLPFHVGIQFS